MFRLIVQYRPTFLSFRKCTSNVGVVYVSIFLILAELFNIIVSLLCGNIYRNLHQRLIIKDLALKHCWHFFHINLICDNIIHYKKNFVMWLDKFLVSVFTVHSSFVGLNILCIVHLYLGGLVVLWKFSRFKIVFKGNEEFFWRNVCFLIKCRKKYVQKKIYDSYFYCTPTGNIKHVGIYNDFKLRYAIKSKNIFIRHTSGALTTLQCQSWGKRSRKAVFYL